MRLVKLKPDFRKGYEKERESLDERLSHGFGGKCWARTTAHQVSGGGVSLGAVATTAQT